MVVAVQLDNASFLEGKEGKQGLQLEDTGELPEAIKAALRYVRNPWAGRTNLPNFDCAEAAQDCKTNRPGNDEQGRDKDESGPDGRVLGEMQT